MAKDLFFIPLGGSGGGGFDPTQYYTKSQIDALIADFVTSSTNSLINYYLKSETYSQSEVNSLISAIETTHFEVYASLSDITNPQSNVLYLVGPIGTGSDKYEIYIYSNNQFVKIDDTSIDLSGYATTTDLQNAINTAMATLQQYAVDNFYQKSEVDAMNSNRVYRKKLTKEDIFEEIEKNKGKQFDPKIADVFLELIKEDKIEVG